MRVLSLTVLAPCRTVHYYPSDNNGASLSKRTRTITMRTVNLFMRLQN